MENEDNSAGGRSRIYNLRVSKELHAALKKYARDHYWSMSMAGVRAVDMMLAEGVQPDDYPPDEPRHEGLNVRLSAEQVARLEEFAKARHWKLPAAIYVAIYRMIARDAAAQQRPSKSRKHAEVG